MKKMILTLAVALSTLCSFAGEGKVNSRVLNAFNSEFNGAKDVTWTAGANYFRAAFVYNDQHVSAFYSAEGDMMAMTRHITSLDLPMSLQTSLKKCYSNYWISDLFELSNDEGTAYYITLENADSKIVLKSDGTTSWDTYSKTTKA
jgi:hypothetical protein